MKLLVVVFIACLTTAGCKDTNPLYCESNDDCTDPAYPICNPTIHGCLGSDDAGSGGDGDGPSADSVYVDDDACPGVGSGSVDDPFCRIQYAVDNLAAGEELVVEPGTYTEDIVISTDTVIRGKEGSRIETASCPGILVLRGASVTIEGLAVTGAGGIWVAGGSTATIRSCTIAGTSCIGIDCQNATCQIARSVVRANTGGGVNLTNSDFTLVNSIVARNSGPFGGVSIDGSNPGSSFVNNTVAYNSADSGSETSGVTCRSPANIENSILWGNSGEDVSQSCTVAYSNLTEEAPGQGNLADDPLFVDEISGNFHIMSNSPCVDAANDAVAPDDDIDGENRPKGLGADMGADEVR